MSDRGEAQQAAIIRKVYQGGYAHAENILHLLDRYTSTMPFDVAIERLHDEVIGERNP